MGFSKYRVRIYQRFGYEDHFTTANTPDTAVTQVVQMRYGRNAYPSAPLRDSQPRLTSVVILEPRKSNTATAIIGGPVKLHVTEQGKVSDKRAQRARNS